MAEMIATAPVDLVPGELRSQPPEVFVHHMPGMIGQRGPNFFQIRKHAEQAVKPRHIITADSPNPREIDDGVFVDALPSATEMYRVGVCLPDTSRLYQRQDVLQEAMGKLHADYRASAGEDGYDPLIEERYIRAYEMSEGNERNALVLSFIVGQKHPPSDVRVAFEKVYVERNLNYRQLSEYTQPSKQFERYARAGHYLLEQIRYVDGDDAAAVTQADTIEAVQRLVDQQPERLHMNGSLLTAAYMVAVNYLGGMLLTDGGRVGINRIHNPYDDSAVDFLPANVARFSLVPGPHIGLGLANIMQISSPLRRVQDGLNGLQLKKLALGIRQDRGDKRVLEEATQLLNAEIFSRHLAKRLHRRYPHARPDYLSQALRDNMDEYADQLA